MNWKILKLNKALKKYEFTVYCQKSILNTVFEKNLFIFQTLIIKTPLAFPMFKKKCAHFKKIIKKEFYALS